MINDLFAIVVCWHMIGAWFWWVLHSAGFAPVRYATCLEFVNPVFIYNTIKVNAFGAAVVSVLLSAMFPFGTLLYWLYKLCTVGRK